MKKEGYRRKTTLEKKTSSLVQVRLGHGSWVNLPDQSVCRVIILTGFLTNPDQSSHQTTLLDRSKFNNYGFNVCVNSITLWTLLFIKLFLFLSNSSI